jgi:methyl-accepting chemotaxis protein
MSILANLSISRKLLAAFGLMATISIGLTAATLTRLNAIATATEQNTQSTTVDNMFVSMLSAMVDQETGFRGYLLSGDPAFLEPVSRGRTAFQATAAEVRARLRQPKSVELLDGATDLAQKWQSYADNSIELMKRPEGREQARTLEARGEGKASMDGIRANLNKMRDGLATVLKERRAAMSDAFADSYLWSYIGIGGLVVAAGLLLYAMGRGIARPITAMTAAMRRLAQGELDIAIPAKGRGDEIGAMAEAVDVFKANAIRVASLKEEEGRKEAARVAERRATRAALADQFEQTAGIIVSNLSMSAGELEAAARTLTHSSEEATQRASAVASASEQTSANVQTVSAATEQSTHIATRAVSEAAQTTARVKQLSIAAERIGDIVGLINDIASKTNLLALNATIEAARAGEAGRGFAIVASEVKQLADQTAKATAEIAGQIGAIQTTTTEAASAIVTISATIEQIREIAGKIASAVDEQSATTNEIARNVSQAAAGTNEVTTNIVDVSRASNDSSSAAAQVLASAGALSGQSVQLRREVETFLTSLRA